jgi:Gelsolin repeat
MDEVTCKFMVSHQFRSVSKRLVTFIIKDEGGPAAGIFFKELGVERLDPLLEKKAEQHICSLWRFDGVGFTKLGENPKQSSLESGGIFVLDLLDRAVSATLFVWVGSQTSGEVRRRAIQVGQDYLTLRHGGSRAASVVRVSEGREGGVFLAALAECQSGFS